MFTAKPSLSSYPVSSRCHIVTVHSTTHRLKPSFMFRIAATHAPVAVVDPNLKEMIVSSKAAPKRRDYLAALEASIKIMKSLNSSNVARVNSVVSNNLLYPIESLPDETPLFEIGAQQLIQLKFASAACECMKFLERDGSSGSRTCYNTFVSVCRAYARVNLELCREFGKSGVLDMVLRELGQMKDTWKDVSYLIHCFTISWLCKDVNSKFLLVCRSRT